MADLIVPNSSPNDTVVSGETTIIQMGYDENATFVVVDTRDYQLVAPYRWHMSRGRIRYAVTSVKVPGGSQVAYAMHRLILGMDSGDRRFVDHIDGDGLNNCRENLRFADRSKNMQNRRKKTRTSSRYKGVAFVPPGPQTPSGRWRAYIQVNGRLRHLGRYATEREAALAYNAAAAEHFGPFACLNEVTASFD